MTLAAEVEQARRRCAAGDAAVTAVLCPVLDPLDPCTAEPDPVLVDAALLVARKSGDAVLLDRQLAWVQYAHTAATTGKADGDQFTATAGWTHGGPSE